MGIIAKALMGIFLFSGAPIHGVLPVATSTPTSTEVVADSDEVPLSRPALIVKLTSYNAVPSQTDGTPFETASGVYSNPKVIAARSNDLAKKLPFGTIIAIERPENQSTCGYSKVESLVGYRVIADSMNRHKRDQVDILLNQRDTVPLGRKHILTNPSIVLGVCNNVHIRVVGYVAVRNIPHTQTALAELVSGNTKSDTLALR